MASAMFALAGAAVSIYLSFYQYHVLSNVWEPFFGNGSRIVLNAGLLAPLSRVLGFEVHDSTLGAAGYGLEATLALAIQRGWSVSRPWLGVAYSGVAVLMGLTSLVLVFLQATVFHSWCTLCLLSAGISEAVVLSSRREVARSVELARHRWFGSRQRN